MTISLTAAGRRCRVGNVETHSNYFQLHSDVAQFVIVWHIVLSFHNFTPYSNSYP